MDYLAFLQKEIHAAAFATLTRDGIRDIAAAAPHPARQEVKRVEEAMDVTQGKLGMGFACGSDDYAAMLMGNTLFGGSSNSKLFLNVREKLSVARTFAENHPEYAINVSSLESVQPKELDASEIEVRLGATWIDPDYITQFMGETFHTPRYLLGSTITAKYAPVNGQWNITGKTRDIGGNALATAT